MRQDNPNQMYHFLHVIGIQDRIDTSHLDDTKPKAAVSSLSVCDFVPSASELKRLKQDITVLVARIIVSEILFLRGAVPEHITHIHLNEMSEKSTVVSNF